MTVRFRAKNFTLTDGAKRNIEEKINCLADLFHPDSVIDVYILKREKDYKCEIKTQRGKEFIRSEEIGKTIAYSVDNALGTMKKRVRKVKSMRITKKRNDGDSLKNLNISLNEEETLFTLGNLEDFEHLDFKIERRKELNLDSLDEADAVLMLESLNHSFYIFKNKELNDKICVLYRRTVGYGIIEIN